MSTEDSIKKQIEIALSVLVGQKFNYIGRGADMLDIGFGNDVEYISSINSERHLASCFALHAHSSWRLLKDGDIFVGQNDFFNHMSGFRICEDNHDVLYIEKDTFSEISEELNKTLKEKDIMVTKIEATELGDLKVYMEDDYCLELFVDASGNNESWRSFSYVENDSPHFVVFEEEE